VYRLRTAPRVRDLRHSVLERERGLDLSGHRAAHPAGARAPRIHALGRAHACTLRITRTGLATLRRWLGPPLPETAAAPAFDAIRTRAGFLRVLSPAQRRRFIATAIAQTEHALARIRELIPTLVYGDDLERIATTGVIDELSARLRWLARLRRAVA
jgi:hypothetical protein